MIVFLLAVLLASLVFLPGWMRSLFRRSASATAAVQVVILFSFELCLSFSIFLTFFSSWFSYWVALSFIAPKLSGIDDISMYWDSPLTPRSCLYYVTTLILPTLVFTKVGLIAIRDAHQVCKEQLDRVRKRHTLGPLWSGF